MTDPSTTTEDTTIPLSPSPGQTTGSVMDATTGIQQDGATAVVRERVDVGFAASGNDPRGRLVSPDFPLPVTSEDLLTVLSEMAEDLKQIRMLLAIALGQS